MANFAITQQESLDSVNYLLSGPSNIGNDFKGKAGNNFVYFPADRLPPYASSSVPAVPPPTLTYIETDMFVPIFITEATQQITLSAQLRPWAYWEPCTPGSEYRFYISLNRYKAPNILFYPTYNALDSDLPEFSVLITDTTGAGADPGGTIVTNGSAGMVYANTIDSPGAIGLYYYWLEMYLEPVSGDLSVEWIGADLRSISASLIKP